MKKKVLVFGLAMVMILTMLTGCGGDGSDTETPPPSENIGTEPYHIEIYTFMNGTSTYVLGLALADLINEHSEWLTATAMESPGPSETAMLLMNEPEKRTTAIGYMIIQDALLGLPPFEGPYEDLRGIASYGLVANSFMTNNDSIKTLYDLEGKTVALGTKPNMPRVDIQEKMFELMDINVKYEYLTFNAAVTALVDGKVDAIIGGGFALSPVADSWSANPAMAELLARDEISYISYDPEEFLLQAKEELGHQLLPGTKTIPAGKYDAKWNQDLTIMADYLGWSCHKDMPAEVITEILTIMADNSSQFVDYVPNGGYITLENMALLDTPEYIHPAAAAFFKERGVEVNTRD